MVDLVVIGTFVVLGIVGGMANIFSWAESWEDLKQFKAFKRIASGGTVGFLYFFLHTDYNFPNFVMSFVAGYAGTDFIQGIIEKLKPK